VKIFLDANILFSGAQLGSPVRKLLDIMESHGVLTTHPGALEEARRNLAAKRPSWMEGFESLCKKCEISSRIGACPPESLLPAKDQPVLAAALGCGADILLTGDRRHFGHLFGSKIVETKICSVRQLAEEMTARGWLGKKFTPP
jgi:predicted nucleic acid-binding protein